MRFSVATQEDEDDDDGSLEECKMCNGLSTKTRIFSEKVLDYFYVCQFSASASFTDIFGYLTCC